MIGWEQVFAEYPYLQTLWDALRVIAPLAMLTAFSGIFFISATGKIIYIARKRSAYDKCSRQLAALGLVLGWTLLIGYRVWLYYTNGMRQEGSLENFILELSWMLLSLGVLLSSIYFILWKILKNMPVVHATIGMISAVQNCLSLISILFAVRISAAVANPATENLLLPDLFPQAWNAPLWTAAALTTPLIFGMAGAWGAAWLPLRRKHDDFGRDYYNQMIPWVCAWARNAWALLWILLVISTGLAIWQEYESGVFNEQNAILESARLLLWLIPIILWTIARKNSVPLRCKWLIYLALLLTMSFMLPYFMEITHI